MKIGMLLLCATTTMCMGGGPKGNVRIDGSSTVYPITEAVAELFSDEAPRVRVTVGISGTGGGMKRFTIGETDISDASRPIKKKELDIATKNGISFIEVPVAYDGLSIVVNPTNFWVEELTITELKKIFLSGGAKTWQEVNPKWPDTPIKIFAPGTDSGTFDYFKEVVAGKKGSIRSDMSVSEDDNVLVNGVAGSEGAIGFFGCAYYFENQDKLKVVPIVDPNTHKGVSPTHTTIASGVYSPFSRPLFIYVNRESYVQHEPVRVFVDFYMKHAAEMAEEVGYVRLPEAIYKRGRTNLAQLKLGTQFMDKDGNKVHGSLEKIYK